MKSLCRPLLDISQNCIREVRDWDTSVHVCAHVAKANGSTGGRVQFRVHDTCGAPQLLVNV